MPSEQNRVNAGTSDSGSPEPVAELRLAAAIIELAREIKRNVPAPRALPYFGLDSDRMYDLAVLDSLSSRGIFRKYELVLLVGSGLGGTGRWLARRLGCRILGVDADAPRTRAARKLNDAAGMPDEVYLAAGAGGALPFREGVFTHVWMIDPLEADRSPRVLAEAFRVLRGGAHFTIQLSEVVPAAIEAVQATLQSVGFVDFSTRAVTLMPPTQTTRTARARLRATLPDDTAKVWRDRELERAAPCCQLFCRRP